MRNQGKGKYLASVCYPHTEWEKTRTPPKQDEVNSVDAHQIVSMTTSISDL